MANCTSCKSTKLSHVSAKCSDMCYAEDLDTKKYRDGYVPSGKGIGGGDYIEFIFCRACGQLQGKFPSDPLATDSEGA